MLSGFYLLFDDERLEERRAKPAGFGAEVVRAVHKVIIEEDEAFLLMLLMDGLV